MSAAKPIRLIVGLANPGREYEATRHNTGAWYVEALARQKGVTLNEDKKYFGLTGSFEHDGEKVWLLIPTTYMNLSGQAVSGLLAYFKLTPDDLVVIHDDLDVPPWRLKLLSYPPLGAARTATLEFA